MSDHIPPVLLLLFNREHCARTQLELLRSVRPSRLFIAADGPRPDHQGEDQLCRQTRRVFDHVDWPCEVQRLEHDSNLGLQEAVLRGATWFFDHVDAGIVIEDDVIVHPDFFRFCDELLSRYRKTQQVRYITANNIEDGKKFGDDSYFFCSMLRPWGWATWSDRWQQIDRGMSEWPRVRERWLGPDATRLERGMVRSFDTTFDGTDATWLRILNYNVMKDRALVITPSRNMVRNIGLGPGATHTTSRRHALSRLVPRAQKWPLSHPPRLTNSHKYDDELAAYLTRTLRRRIRDTLRNFRLI